MLSADQKPLVATEPSPPRTTADGALPGRVVEGFSVVADGVGPAGGGGVLGADAASHGQDAAAVVVGHVEDDADVASIADAAGLAQAALEGFGDGEAKRKQERARTVVAAGGIVGAGEQGAEQDLAELVAACAELIEDLLLREESCFFEVVEGA